MKNELEISFLGCQSTRYVLMVTQRATPGLGLTRLFFGGGATGGGLWQPRRVRVAVAQPPTFGDCCIT